MKSVSALPITAGLGFKPQHYADLLRMPREVGFIEVHAENYMGDGGPPHAMLADLRDSYALSLHGVGLSIGGEDPLDREHLSRLKRLCDRYEPESFSEHLAWSSHGEFYLNDLLPLPYTNETLKRVACHVDQVQETLQREMLLENPATYLQFEESEMSECEFLAEISRRTGCALLLDVNNVFVQAVNHGTRPEDYMDGFPLHRVKEIHLGGHDLQRDETGAPLLIDAHGSPVADRVWSLFARAVDIVGPLPTLIEWDNNVPEFAVLADEARAANGILRAAAARRAA